MSALNKSCAKCSESKLLADFKRDNRYGDGHSSYCKRCHQEATVAWQKANPERVKASRRARYARRLAAGTLPARVYKASTVRVQNRRRLYGAGPEWYASKLKEQGGSCAICGRRAEDFARPLAIDHDHACCKGTPTCGQCNRGLLCPTCNTSLHAVERHPAWFSAAKRYLKGYTK